MMAYLTRPGFNGGGSVSNKTVLPKKENQQQKLRKEKNKLRKD